MDIRRSAARAAMLTLGSALVFSPSALFAQDTSSDSAFRVGHCPGTVAESSVWNRVADSTGTPATPKHGMLPHPPLEWRDKNGHYEGRVVLAFVVDAEGRVIPGTSSIVESTDARLSEWACSIVADLRYVPATMAGKPVMALKEQPPSYHLGDAPLERKPR